MSECIKDQDLLLSIKELHGGYIAQTGDEFAIGVSEHFSTMERCKKSEVY